MLRICIIFICCCLGGICRANSWDQFISEKSVSEITVPKVVKFPKIENKEIREKVQPSLECLDDTLQAHHLKKESKKDESVFLENAYSDRAFSQWFDNNIRPQYRLRGGLVQKTQFGNLGSAEIAELDLNFCLFNLLDVLPGCSLDVWGFGEGMYFSDNPGISNLPDCLIAAGIDVGFCCRFENGFSWEFRGSPGVYSDLSNPDLSITGTINLHYTFSDTFCLVLGATYRPKWEEEWVPNVGLIWQPSDIFRIHTALPESRIDIFPHHVINFFGTVSWNNTTYWLDSSHALEDTITFDTICASVGATLTIFGDLQLSAEFGSYFHYELKGGIVENESIEADETTFIRASIGNSF